MGVDRRRPHSHGMTDATSPLRRAAFHVSGALLYVLAAVAALVAFALASFGLSTCGDVTSRAGELRAWSLVIVLSLAAVPAGWSWLASCWRRAWQPWAAIALGTALIGIAEVSSIREVGSFCF